MIETLDRPEGDELHCDHEDGCCRRDVGLPCDGAPAAHLYLMVGDEGTSDPFTLADFLRSNADAPVDDEDLAAMRALAVGGEHDFQSLGGGVVRRVS